MAPAAASASYSYVWTVKLTNLHSQFSRHDRAIEYHLVEKNYAPREAAFICFYAAFFLLAYSMFQLTSPPPAPLLVLWLLLAQGGFEIHHTSKTTYGLYRWFVNRRLKKNGSWLYWYYPGTATALLFLGWIAFHFLPRYCELLPAECARVFRYLFGAYVFVVYFFMFHGACTDDARWWTSTQASRAWRSSLDVAGSDSRDAAETEPLCVDPVVQEEGSRSACAKSRSACLTLVGYRSRDKHVTCG